MKKVIVIVLALVMVFAIAAPAMALTDAPLTTVDPAASNRFAVSIRVIGGMPGYGTTMILPEVAANKAWIVNEPVYYYINLTAKKGFPVAHLTDDEQTESTIRISGNGVDVTTMVNSTVAYMYDASAKLWEPLSSEAFAAVPGQNVLADKVDTYLKVSATVDGLYAISGIGVVTGTVAEPSISVNIGLATMTDDSEYCGIPVSGTILPRIQKDGTIYTVTFAENQVATFQINPATNKCIQITYNHEIVTYGDGASATPDTYGTVYDYEFDGYWDATKKAGFLAIMNYMGFDYAKINTNAVLMGHFIAKIADPKCAGTVSVPLYTAAITVPPVDAVRPPKTGDAASILGFVMIGLALVAAAAFTYKKVRA